MAGGGDPISENQATAEIYDPQPAHSGFVPLREAVLWFATADLCVLQRILRTSIDLKQDECRFGTAPSTTLEARVGIGLGLPIHC